MRKNIWICKVRNKTVKLKYAKMKEINWMRIATSKRATNSARKVKTIRLKLGDGIHVQRYIRIDIRYIIKCDFT